MCPELDGILSCVHPRLGGLLQTFLTIQTGTRDLLRDVLPTDPGLEVITNPPAHIHTHAHQ